MLVMPAREDKGPSQSQSHPEKETETQCKEAGSEGKNGPGRFMSAKGGKGWAQIPVERVNDISRFWKGVWEVESSWNQHHEAITEWTNEMREQTKPLEGDDPITREAAWDAASKKMPSWKAPGPDGIPGFWLKAFPEMLKKLKGYPTTPPTQLPPSQRTRLPPPPNQT